MTFSLRNRILAAVFVLTSLAAFNAKADLASCGVDLGEAGQNHWAVFTLGNGVTQNVDIEGQGFVTGDVGAAGNGNVLLGSSQARINGNLYYHTHGTLSNAGIITGSKFQNAATDTLLDDAAADAQEASDAAFGMLATSPYQSLTNIKVSGGNNMTITGSGCVVLQLQNFSLNSGTLTLQGTAGTSFIINVSNQFSLTNNSQIVLGAGIRPQDVLFNVHGTGTQVSVAGSSQFNGILLATQRTVSITGQSRVTGEVIANSVVISGNASVVTPTTNR
jgi:cytoskeletal protein CcmA (bactofilin family)